jgi:hypothetical protein
MRIFRARNPEVLSYIKPHFVVDSEAERERLAAWLAQQLIDSPTTTFILVGFEDQTDVLAGFIVAITEPSVEWAFVLQAWTDPKLTSSGPYTIKAFSQIALWAEEQGRTELRMQTKRDDAFARKWGFKEHSVIMTFNIDENFDRILEAARALKEKSNGIKRPEKQVVSDGGTESHQRLAGEGDYGGTEGSQGEAEAVPGPAVCEAGPCDEGAEEDNQ